MPHMIRQQFVHVELNGTQSEGMALQRRLPDLCHHHLTPAVERALDRCQPPDGHLVIERLDIDVGAVTLDNLERELAELVAVTLEDAVRELRWAETVAEVAGEVEPVQHKTDQQSLYEAFVHFLDTGSLSWSFRLPAGSDLEQALLNSWREAASSGELPHALRDAIVPALASATTRQRLIRQFSPELLAALLPILSPEAENLTEEIVPLLHSADLSPAVLAPFEQEFWQTVFAHAAAGEALSVRRLVGESWQAQSKTTEEESMALARVLERRWPGVTTTDPTKTDRTVSADSVAPSRAGYSAESEAATGAVRAPEEAGEHSGSPEAQQTGRRSDLLAARASWMLQDIPAIQEGAGGRSESQDIETVRGHPEAAEGIYVGNAGLVLLHPFLSRFFSALDIAGDERLLQPERALRLLHFLATGQATAPEYEMVLPKILCNVPLTASVVTDLALTDTEMDEAVVLLEAVIRHWDVLQSTSPDGLRGAFLLRPGKVSQREDGDWLLQVEASSVDILLDQLPWGLSIVKLPWMNRMLWVEWRNVAPVHSE